MTSPIYTPTQIQTIFTEELDSIVKDPLMSKNNIEKIVKEMLREGGDIKPLLIAIPLNLQGRVKALYSTFNLPALEKQPATKGFLKGLLKQTLSTLREERFARIFTSICPPYRLPVFKATLNSFLANGLAEGMDINQAIVFASAKALSYLTVSLPTLEFIAEDPDLADKITEDPVLQAYECKIALDIPADDSVYLEDTDDKGKTHKHYYHEAAIYQWIAANGRDPLTDKPRTLRDIKQTAPQIKDLIKNRLIALAYPEVAIGTSSSDTSSSQSISTNSVRFLLTMKVSYFQVIAYANRFLDGERNPHIRIAEIERFSRESFAKLAMITFKVKFNWEEIPLECLPFIEMFINIEASKDIPTAEAASNLQRKIEIFLPIFSRMQDSKIAISINAATIDRVSKAIDKGCSLERTWDIIQRADEDAIRARFPGCLRGAKEWETYIRAEVEDVPIPEGILEILEQPSINIEGFPEGSKVGETHMLVLMPEKVNRKEFSFEDADTLFSNIKIAGAWITGCYIESYDSQKKAFESSYWALIPKGILKESANKSYEEQVAMVHALPNRGREPAAVSRLFELTVAVCVEKIISGANLFTGSIQRCEKNSDPNLYPRLQPREDERGIYIDEDTESPLPSEKHYMGAVWRFQPYS